MSITKKYIVSSYIPDTEYNFDFLDAMRIYSIRNQAQLILFPTAPNYKDDVHTELNTLVHESLERYIRPLGFAFNDKLAVPSLTINVNQLDPLSGFDRLAAMVGSLIIPFPRHRMKMVPRMLKDNSAPRAMWCTGTISSPNYKSNKTALSIKEYHVIGALSIELHDTGEFNVRQLEWDGNGFYDLDVYYTKTNFSKNHRVEAMTLGDDHAVFLDGHAINKTKEMIKLMKPKTIIHQDTFDSVSISHHTVNMNITRALIATTLEQEGKITSDYLQDMINTSGDAQHILMGSNHIEHLDKYLEEARYVNDHFNHILALELAWKMASKQNHLEYLLKKFNPLERFKITNRHDSLKIKGIEMLCHGDFGIGGTPGTPMNTSIVYNGNVISGHTHTPEITALGGYVTGTLTKLTLPYTNASAGSKWCHSNVVVYPNGKRANLIIL